MNQYLLISFVINQYVQICPVHENARSFRVEALTAPSAQDLSVIHKILQKGLLVAI